MSAAELPSQNGGRRLLRSRRSRWLGGVFGGLGDYFGINPGWVRLGFFVSIFLGLNTLLGESAIPVAIFLYVIAWIVIPLERPEGASPVPPGGEIKGHLAGLTLVGLASIALLLLGDGSSIGIGGILAPILVALGAIIVRRGPGVQKAALAVTALVLTPALAAANYQPGIGERLVEPDYIRVWGSQYSNLFGDMTVDLTELEPYGGEGHIYFNTGFGDLILILPANAEVALHGTLAFADVEAFGAKVEEAGLARNATFREHGDAGLVIHVHLNSAFGTVRIVR
jgi:phage shock protein PspC (stress-responsive transcriptional regulator)